MDFPVKIALTALLLFAAIPAAAQQDTDECQLLLAAFDEIVQQIEEVCESEPPCDVDGSGCPEEPPPDESCPDSDACVFADGFESGDTSAWDAVVTLPWSAQ